MAKKSKKRKRKKLSSSSSEEDEKVRRHSTMFIIELGADNMDFNTCNFISQYEL